MSAPPVRDDASDDARAAPVSGTGPGEPVYRVCFVCTGNICRSPMAASVFRARVAESGLGERVTVDSAGTGGWFEGECADQRTVSVLTAHGYPHDHVARQFRPEWFADRDLVIALDAGHLHALRHLARSAGDFGKVRLLRSYDPAADKDDLDVPDPYYGEMDGFHRCLDLIEAAATGLLEAVRAALTGPGLDGDAAPAPAG